MAVGLEFTGAHTPEDGQVLGELDHLLHHERVDVCKVPEQWLHGDQAGRAQLVGEQVLWGLWGPEPSEAAGRGPGSCGLSSLISRALDKFHPPIGVCHVAPPLGQPPGHPLGHILFIVPEASP